MFAHGFAGPDIALNSGRKVALNLLYEIDVVLASDFAFRFRLKQVLQLEVVMSADDRSPRNAREDVKVPQHVELRQHANMEKRSTESTA